MHIIIAYYNAYYNIHIIITQAVKTIDIYVANK